MLIRATDFKGIYPLVAPHLLPDNAGQVAQDVVLDSGDLMPLKAGAEAVDQTYVMKAGTTSVYWYDRQHWLSWSGGQDVDVVPSPVPADVNGYQRLYWTLGGDSYPQVSDHINIVGQNPGQYSLPANSYRLGMLAPAKALSVTGQISFTTTSQSRSFAYVYTRVSERGEESVPSPATETRVADDGTEVRLSGFTQESGPDTDTNVLHYKLYRTNTGTNGTDWQQVMTLHYHAGDDTATEAIDITDGMIPLNVAAVYESVKDADLGSLLRTQGWNPPPQGMSGLVGHPSGFLAGFKNNVVYVSVPYMPHAWPYEYTFYETIVGLASYGQTLLVLTDGSPYMLTGVDPSALSQERLESGFACVSKRSIVDMGDNIVYASPYGLVSVNTDTIRLVTKEHIGKRGFAELLPSDPNSLQAYCHDRKYIAFGTPRENKTGGVYLGVEGFIFDFAVNELSTHTVPAACAYSDDVTGQIFYVGGANGTTLYRWDEGSAKTATWRSRIVNLPGPTNFAGCRILADGYAGSITLTVYGYLPGVALPKTLTYTVTGPEPFMLHSGFTAARYEFMIESAQRIRSVELFHDVTELFNG